MTAEVEAKSEPDLLRLCALAVRLLHWPLPASGPEAAYLFQELDPNVSSVVDGAKDLLSKRPQIRLLVLDVFNDRLGQPISNGYGATPYLTTALAEKGVDKECIVHAAFDHAGMINTLNEAEAVVMAARANGWKSLAIVAPPFHLLRAAVTVASVALREYPDLRVHPVAGSTQSWQEPAFHSQGMPGIRGDFIMTEMERVVRYTAKGDIAAWTDLEAYFTRCERGS